MISVYKFFYKNKKNLIIILGMPDFSKDPYLYKKVLLQETYLIMIRVKVYLDLLSVTSVFGYPEPCIHIHMSHSHM